MVSNWTSIVSWK